MDGFRELFMAWIAQYGAFGLFSLLVLGIIGLPVPDEILLTYSGFLCFRGRLSMPEAMIAGFAGAVCGITLSYGIGRVLGTERIERLVARFGVSEEKLAQVRAWFERRGKWALVFGYFVPGVRHFTAIVAGTSHLRLHTFAPFAYTGALIWSQTFLVLGYTLGNGWERASETIHRRSLLVSAIVVALGLVYLAWRHLARRARARRVAAQSR